MIVNSTLLLLLWSHWNERIGELVAIRNVRQTQTANMRACTDLCGYQTTDWLVPGSFNGLFTFQLEQIHSSIWFIWIVIGFVRFSNFFRYFLFRTCAFGIVFLGFVDFSVACECNWNVFSGTNGKILIEHENHIQSESGSM